MTSLFLRKVELSNFRVYGDSYTFDFEPSPGITLVVGANGLGKTTLFDGIEWALTGEVSRFADIPPDGKRHEFDPLTRLGQPEGSHRVGLVFSDGPPIDRGQGIEPTQEEITHLLREPEWAEIGDLHRYLSITHFLGQAASRRFSVRKPKEQWEALKGPAGVDRINFIKDRLGGQSARQSFTRAIKAATDALSRASAEASDWRQLRGERDRLAALSAMQDALPPDRLAVVANELAARVVEHVPVLIWSDIKEGELPESFLSRLSSFCATAEEFGRSERSRLEALKPVADEFADTTIELSVLTSSLADVERRLGELTGSLAEAEAGYVLSQQAVATSLRRRQEAETRLGVLSRAAEARTRLAAATTSLRDLDEGLERVSLSEVGLDNQRVALEQRLVVATTEIEKSRRLEANLAAARRRSSIAEKWSIVRNEIDKLSELVRQADERVLRTEREQLFSKLTVADGRAATLQSELRQIDEGNAAVAAAVAAITLHLAEHDTNCPVCNTTFPIGELLRRAQVRPAERSTTAFAIANQLAATEREKAEITTALKTLEGVLTLHLQNMTALAVVRAEEQQLHQQFVEAGGSPTEFPQSDTINIEVRALEDELRALQASIAEGSTIDLLRAEQQSVAAQIEADATRRSDLIRRRADFLSIIEGARAQLREVPSFESGVEGDLVAAQAIAADQLEKAEEALKESQDRAEVHRLQLDDLRARIAADEATRQVSTGRLSSSSERRDFLVRQWQTAGLTGDPNSARVNSQLTLAANRLASVRQAAERQSQLLVGYRRWLDDQTLSEVQRRITNRIVGFADEDAVTLDIEKRVDEATSRLRRAERARERMDTVVGNLQTAADDYARKVLLPLNKTINNFSRALMTWSDVVIAYHAEHYANRAELRPSAVQTAPDGSTNVLDINPNKYFSEGQLSALSVSALLAASTSFRWSRWRGLLMDDPLQHNDVIHASAFMDLIGQLVRRLDYQVIISSHDSAEAAFLIRKCESSGIPLRVHELQPSGEEGLVSAVA